MNSTGAPGFSHVTAQFAQTPARYEQPVGSDMTRGWMLLESLRLPVAGFLLFGMRGAGIALCVQWAWAAMLSATIAAAEARRKRDAQASGS